MRRVQSLIHNPEAFCSRAHSPPPFGFTLPADAQSSSARCTPVKASRIFARKLKRGRKKIRIRRRKPKANPGQVMQPVGRGRAAICITMPFTGATLSEAVSPKADRCVNSKMRWHNNSNCNSNNKRACSGSRRAPRDNLYPGVLRCHV